MTSRSQQVDQAIVAELRRDARQSNVALAKQVGLTEGAVRRRIDNLVESGVVRFTVAVDPSFGGRDTHAILRIRCAPHLVDDVLDDLARASELEHLFLCTGPFDITAVGHFASNAELREFQTSRLGSIPGIVEIQSDVVLQIVETAGIADGDETTDDDDNDNGDVVDDGQASDAPTTVGTPT